MPPRRRKALNNKPCSSSPAFGGILLIDKPKGNTSFSLIRFLRKRLNIKKIGHAGTLDPFATGVMVFLIGRNFTRLSDRFLNEDKEYVTQVHLGVTTDSFDKDGKITGYSEKLPSLEDIEAAVAKFQGKVMQTPPMFSAKKVNGRKLYELAREGKTIERKPVEVELQTTILNYEYPFLDLKVCCSKGTYIRSIANDLGAMLGCGGHLSQLERVRSGQFTIHDCIRSEQLYDDDFDLTAAIRAA